MLNRRTLLAATAASVAASTLPGFAASSFAFDHGTFYVTIVSDGHLVLPTSFLAPDAQRPSASRYSRPLGKSANNTTHRPT
ncbi:MAG: hypothetical protein WCD54_13555 [Pseudolabrys sp.]